MADCPGYRESQADERDTSVHVGSATDLEWHLNPQHPHLFCGGCGTDACHPGQCCTDVPDQMGVLDRVCDLCPDRRATGQVAAP